MKKIFVTSFFAVLLFAGFSQKAYATVYYYPLFTTTSGLASTTGLSIASGGGIIATSNGTNGTAFVDFPTTIDNTKPWRISVLFEYNGDASHNTLVGLYPAIGVDQGAHEAIVGFAGGQLFSANGFSQVITGDSTLVSGQKYWGSIISDGTKVTTSLAPYNHLGIFTTNFNATAADYQVTKDYNFAPSASTAFTSLVRLGIGNASASTKVLGVYVNTASTTGVTSDSRMEPTGVLQPLVGVDNTVTVRFPAGYDGITPVDMVYVDHPNNSGEYSGSIVTAPDGGAAFASLLNAGYMVVYSRGDPNSFSSASSSPWGAPGTYTLGTRKAVIDYVKANYGPIRNVYWVGQSMGVLDGLNYALQYPGTISAIAGISGVTNLSDTYTNRGYASTINGAYGVSSVGSVAAYDPNLNASQYVGMPLKLWHGDSDTAIPESMNATLFKTNIEAAGGPVSVVTIAGSDHLQSPLLWDGPSLVSFFGDNTAPIISSIGTSTANTTATVTWNTDEGATTQVEYGPGASEVASSTLSVTLGTSHTASIASLPTCTWYRYRVKTFDLKYNTATSSDAAFLTSGCVGNASVATSTSATITTAAGGTLPFGTTTISVPTSFTGSASSAAFQAKQLDPTAFFAAASTTPAGLNEIGNYVVDLKAVANATTTISSFSQPITVTLAYSPSDITGLSESNATIYRYDSGLGWTALTGCSVNTSAHTITCQTSNFSDFAIFTTLAPTPTVSSSTGGVAPITFIGGPSAPSTYVQTNLSTTTSACLPGYKFNIMTGAPCTTTISAAANSSNSPQATPPTSTAWLFTKDLYFGMSDSQVKLLQQFLNTHGSTIALTGAGAVGHETTLFGNATKAALVKFQKAKGISPAVGYFGLITRTYISSHQ